MSEEKVDNKKGSIDFSEFWDNFQILPWKWVDKVFDKPTFFGVTIGSAYAILFLLTFFPDNGLMEPVNLLEVGYYDFAYWIQAERLLLLKHYPSTNILLLAFLVVILLAIRWRHKIPDFFQRLWSSGNLETQEGDLAQKFHQYLLEYQNALLSRWGTLIIGTALFLLTAGLVLKAGMFPFVDITFTPVAAFMLKVVICTATFWMFLIGQVCWVAYITARYISQLPKRFSIRIRVSHPDKCGGLKPIGDFFIDLAVILIVGGAAFAAIAILDMDIDQVLRGASTIFLFALIGPLSALVVFPPIWNIHELMVENKNAYLDRYGSQLKDLESVIFDHTRDSGDLDRAIQAKEKLEILRVIHPETTKFPVWPIRVTSTVLFMFSPQIVQTVIEIVFSIYDWASTGFSF